MKKKAIFNWSSGKDSAFALYKILQEDEFEIQALVTSINTKYRRVSMHGIREELVEKQAKSIGIPLIKIELPESPTMEEYNSIMRKKMEEFVSEGITYSVFGDIYLEDLRNYREQKLKEVGMEGVFPLWKMPTKQLIREFLNSGFKTIITTVNESYMDKKFVGKVIDESFLNKLPAKVDPCGENGEYHSFAFDGPVFKVPIEFELGERIRKTYPKPKTSEDEMSSEFEQYGFWYMDLVTTSSKK